MEDHKLTIVKQVITNSSFMLLGALLTILITGATKAQIYSLTVVFMVLAFVASLASKILLNVDIGTLAWSIQGGVIFSYFGLSPADIKTLFQKK